MNIKKIFILFLVLAACAYIFLFPFESLRVGGEFMSASRFEKYVKKEGYVIIGSFNVSWPGTIVETHEDDNQIVLNAALGLQTQKYTGFQGYRLKSVVMKKNDGLHSGFVLRSKEIVNPVAVTPASP